jgi:hypothetical protein
MIICYFMHLAAHPGLLGCWTRGPVSRLTHTPVYPRRRLDPPSESFSRHLGPQRVGHTVRPHGEAFPPALYNVSAPPSAHFLAPFPLILVHGRWQLVHMGPASLGALATC